MRRKSYSIGGGVSCSVVRGKSGHGRLRSPPILARLQRPRRLARRRAFGVRRRFLYRLRGGNQDGKESEKAEEFHVVWCVEKADAEGYQKASANE